MLIAIDDDYALLQTWADRERPAFLKVDKQARTERLDFADAFCQTCVAADGKLVLLGKSGDFVVDMRNGFACAAITPWDGTGTEPCWTFATTTTLIDSMGCRSREYAYDRNALNLPDPGYSEPTGACLLPGGDEIAIAIVRCEHMALFNRRTGATELVELAGSYGSSGFHVVGNDLWLVNYDVLCRLDLRTRQLHASAILQPPHRDPKHGWMTKAFVGEPSHAPDLGGWLLPRPYNGDVLFVNGETLSGDGRWRCGGSPYEVVMFPDGALLIADSMGTEVRTAHLRDLER